MDDEKNNLNIVAYHLYEKFDAEEFSDLVIKRARLFPRLKSRVVKLLGKYMFQMMDESEFLANKERYCSIHSGVHTEEELAEFMTNVQCVREPLDWVQWRIYLFPDYGENESVMIYKVHHSLADGIATILMYFNLTDNPDVKEFP